MEEVEQMKMETSLGLRFGVARGGMEIYGRPM